MEKENKSFKTTFIVLMVLCLLIFLADRTGMIKQLRGGLESFLIPLESFIYQKRLSFSGHSSLEVSQLQEENRKLINKIVQLENCQKENSDMRRLLGAPLPSDWKFLPAKVIGNDEGTLILDKGAKDNLKVGAIAFYENTFIGKIIATSDNISRIETPKSSNSKILVMVKRTDDPSFKVEGLLISQNNKIYLQKIQLSDEIKKNDLIFTTTQTGLPPDLAIGKISEILKKDNSLFQTVQVEPLVDYQKINNVFLVNF